MQMQLEQLLFGLPMSLRSLHTRHKCLLLQMFKSLSLYICCCLEGSNPFKPSSAGALKHRLQEKINTLSDSFNGPRFEPHVTLVPGFDAPGPSEAIAATERIAKDLQVCICTYYHLSRLMYTLCYMRSHWHHNDFCLLVGPHIDLANMVFNLQENFLLLCKHRLLSVHYICRADLLQRWWQLCWIACSIKQRHYCDKIFAFDALDLQSSVTSDHVPSWLFDQA